jgi:hypothetical protein
MGNWLGEHAEGVRWVAYVGVGLAVIAGVISNIGDEQFSWRSVLLPLALVAVLIAAVEIILRLARPRNEARFAAKQEIAIGGEAGLAKLFDGEGNIEILGGTLKTLTLPTSVLDALRRHVPKSSVRVLLMHPDGEGLLSEASARVTLNKPGLNADARKLAIEEELQKLRAEVERSLERLENYFSIAGEHVKLYKEHRTNSFYRRGDECLLTVYTMGHGANSPSIYLPASKEREDFVNGLSTGFEAIWSAATTQTVEQWRTSVANPR